MAYSLSPSKYVQENVRLVENYLEERHGICLKKGSRAKSPLPANYRPELDMTEELESISIPSEDAQAQRLQERREFRKHTGHYKWRR